MSQRRVGRRRIRTAVSARSAGSVAVLAAVIGLAAWLLAIPLAQTPDEPSHIYHSWGTVTGQTVPSNEIGGAGSGTRIEVPETLLRTPHPDCFDDTGDAATPCPSLRADTDDQVAVTSYMTRYPPLYYAVTGSTLLALTGVGLPGETTIVITRALSAATCAALLVWASLLLSRAYGALATCAVLLVGLTPTAFGLFVAVNPNGLEIASAVLLAAAVLGVRRRRPDIVPLSAAVAVPVATTALAWSRPLSWVWAGTLLSLLLVPAHGRPLPIRRVGRVPRGVTMVSMGGSLVWFGWAAQARAPGGTEPTTVADWVSLTVPERLVLVLVKFGDLTEQAVGLFGWSDTPAPTIVVAAFVAVGGALLLLALASPGLDVPGWAPIAVLAVGACTAAAHTLVTAFGWQGRYLLAFTAAAIVLTAPSLSAVLTSPAVARVARGVLVVVVLPLHALVLAIVLWRFVFGQQKFVFRFPVTALPVGEVRWEPAVGDTGVLALSLLALALASTAVVLAPAVASGPSPQRSDRAP